MRFNRRDCGPKPEPESEREELMLLRYIARTQEIIMADLAQLVTDDDEVAAQVTLLVTAYDNLVTALNAGTLTDAQQAQVDAADAELQTTKASIVAALAAANTAPPATSDPVPPVGDTNPA